MVSDAEGQAAATAAMDVSAFAHMERLLREETKGEFVVRQMLGRGGMAVVYLAEETKLGRKVALKVLPPELTFGHGVDRFLREAKTAATLDHPNIIPIYRIAAEGKLFWYAMKYLEGKSLEDVLKERGTFGLDETIDLLEQTADALDYAHEHQVIHRDIKPANVMLDRRDRVIITDFGIAKALSEGALTASGSVIGTPYYMSPEQGMGKPVSGASDQYSVGVMAYRMLAGQVPYDGDSAIDILHKHCMSEVPRLEDVAPHIPQHVCDAIEKAMAKKAAERFPNIRAFVRAMREPGAVGMRPSTTVLIDSGELEKVNAASRSRSGEVARRAPKPAAATAAKTSVMAPPTAPTSKAPLWAAIAAVVVIGGGAGAWALFGRGAPTADPAPQVSATPPDATRDLAAAPSDGASGASAGSQSGAGTAATPSSRPTEPAATQAAPTDAGRQTAARDPVPAPTRQQPETRPQTQPVQTPPSRPTQQATPAAAAPAGFALLRLVLSPPGTVTINGVPKGEQSRYQEQLTPGQHLIRIEREGYVTRDTVLAARGGDTLRLDINLERRP